MSDLVETSSQGWLSRIMESIKGVLVGLAMVVAAFPLLFVNEGCAVKIAKGLAEGRGAVVEAQAAQVNPAQEGKLVHLTGQATTKMGVKDSELGIAMPTAIRLERVVEMYQWKEKTETKKEKKVGGKEETTKTTTYVQEWSQSEQDSSKFKLKKNKEGKVLFNPKMEMKSGGVVAKDVTVGAFALSENLLNQLTGGDAIKPDQKMIDALPADLKARARISGEYIYIGSDPAKPAVGDMRIKLSKIEATTVSIVAQQVGKQLVPWATQQGTTIGMLDKGTLTADQMFKNAEDGNAMRTWIIRLVGFLMMLFGFMAVFKPLSVVADVVPFIGSVVSMGTGVVAFVLAAPLSLITIAVAWIFYRPLLGIALLVVGIGIFAGIFVMSKKRQAAAAGA